LNLVKEKREKRKEEREKRKEKREKKKEERGKRKFSISLFQLNIF
jgi:hypothetical protein